MPRATDPPSPYGGAVPGPRLLVVDNYDSFTYNLVQQAGELGADVEVVRNDAVTVSEVAEAQFDGLLISPGPGTPADAGISNALLRDLGGRVPILGVCLGHQCIGAVFGADVVRAPELVHGKASLIHHDDRGVFAGLGSPFPATRYHSLVVAEDSVPRELVVTARTPPGHSAPRGLVMGLRHRDLPIEGVQFHPESILTEVGPALLANFLRSLPVPVGA